MLTTGDKLWNGATVTPSLATAYNSIQGRIASFQDAGRPVPDYLLNGAHNLIASALPDEPDAIVALRALNVPAMTQAAIYDMRESIGHLIASAKWDARELCDHQETRASGVAHRHYIETCETRLASVTRP